MSLICQPVSLYSTGCLVIPESEGGSANGVGDSLEAGVGCQVSDSGVTPSSPLTPTHLVTGQHPSGS